MQRWTRGTLWRSAVAATGAVVLALGLAAPASAGPDIIDHDPGGGGGSGSSAGAHAQRMRLLYNDPTGATNSDMAFWGNRAFVGNYNGFRIYDISGRTPKRLVDFVCYGPQNDITVYDSDRDGQADLLFTSVDVVLTGPQCGATAATNVEDPAGWEGIRVFDVRDPTKPRQIGAVYQDCGSHTHTLVPDPRRNRVLLYNASYSLRPGPTCGAVRGPAVGRDPLHGVIQIVGVPLRNPAAAREVAERPINYPGDPDNAYDPAEHGIPAAAGFGKLRACHDMGVYLPGRLVGAACAEQAQLWRIGPDMMPDTANPIWVYDDNVDTDGPGGGDVNVDFWHSATFSWDGRIVNFSDESFGSGCPPVTPGVGDTGRTHFLSTRTGEHLSHFMINRSMADGYCSTHQGNVVPTRDRYLLVQAWYQGGADVVDFTNPRRPREVAYYDEPTEGEQAGSNNWAHYWYERRSRPGWWPMTTYATDGFSGRGRGFEKFHVHLWTGTRYGMSRLNPQTQEAWLPSRVRVHW